MILYFGNLIPLSSYLSKRQEDCMNGSELDVAQTLCCPVLIAEQWSYLHLARKNVTDILFMPPQNFHSDLKKTKNALNYYLLNKCLRHELKYDREPTVNCKPNLICVHDISPMFANIICCEVVVNSFSFLINSISVCNLFKI